VLEEVAGLESPPELLRLEEEVVAPVDLSGARLPGGGRGGELELGSARALGSAFLPDTGWSGVTNLPHGDWIMTAGRPKKLLSAALLAQL
jgi:hypothetical protein